MFSNKYYINTLKNQLIEKTLTVPFPLDSSVNKLALEYEELISLLLSKILFESSII